jgi:adenylosuccinate lyase
MIPRYTRPEMAAIWTDRHRLDIWLKIETLAVEGWAKIGAVPRRDADVILKRAGYDLDRVFAIEKVTRHDVVAFTQAMAEKVNDPASRWIHFGLTSSDVLDTCFAVQLVEAADLLIRDIKEFRRVLKRKAMKYRHTVMIGRSHGIHAEPITFGLTMALWYDEMGRNLERMARAKEAVRVGQISGAVGTYAHLDPRVEKHVMKKLGLNTPNVTTQVLQRDRHAEFFTTLAVIASSLEKFSIQVRHWQRTEVLEAEEFFHQGQKGSSAMPHKRNPIASENTTGLARVVRAAAVPALENVALWHERDISHSSVERVIAPDSTIALDYALARFTGIVDRLIVYPQRMKQNLALTRGLYHSEGVLLALVRTGLTREQAYALVQRSAMKVWEEGKKDFLSYLLADPEVVDRLGEKGLKQCFDEKRLLQKVDMIFGRVFK